MKMGHYKENLIRLLSLFVNLRSQNHFKIKLKIFCEKFCFSLILWFSLFHKNAHNYLWYFKKSKIEGGKWNDDTLQKLLFTIKIKKTKN